MDGLHHAREWPSGELTIMFGFDLLEGYGNDARVTALMQQVRTVLVPVVNPDGFHHSRESLVQAQGPLAQVFGGAGQEAYWRKNRRSPTGVTAPVVQKNPDAYGIDVNRNYGFNWGGPGASRFPLDQTSHGDAPFSEPESENVRRLLNAFPPCSLNSNHTYSDLVLRPLGWTDKDSPDEALLEEFGDAMGDITGYRSQKSVHLYPTTGTTMDYGYGAFGAMSYTFEHGRVFHPPYASNVPAMYEANRDAFLLLAEAAADPRVHAGISGRIVDGAGSPVAAELTVAKTYDLRLWPSNITGEKLIQEHPAMTVDTGADGSFLLRLPPSRRPFEAQVTAPYELTVRTPGHGEKTVTVTAPRGHVVNLGDIALT